MSYTRADFADGPMLVFYELTRACDLACVHCRADAQTHRNPRELSPGAGRQLVDQLSGFAQRPMLVLTGGDPLKRPDVFDLVEYAVARQVVTALTPSATPLVTAAALNRLKAAGLHRLAVSLDGSDADTHDAFRRVPGSFERTLWIMRHVRSIGLPFQVNLTLGRHNVHQLDDLLAIAADHGACLASVFFLVPTGRATARQRLDAQQIESVFARLWDRRRGGTMPIKTTEAPHYRRFILQQQQAGSAPVRDIGQVGTNDGKGILFVSHIGDIYPSGFLPMRCGTFPADSIVQVYREHPLFRSLRDPGQLGGKCGRCEYRVPCGGSRARAYAIRGDPLAEEPDCVFQPSLAVGAP